MKYYCLDDVFRVSAELAEALKASEFVGFIFCLSRETHSHPNAIVIKSLIEQAFVNTTSYLFIERKV